MKNLSLLIVVLVACTMLLNNSLRAQTSSKLEVESRFVFDEYKEFVKVKPQFTLFTAYSDTASNLGMWVFSLVSDSWAEMYTGIQYSPASWISFGVGTGVEVYENPWRAGSWIWIGYEGASLFQAYEYGGSGFWYQVKARFQTEGMYGLGFGVLAERYKGVGPEILYKIPGLPATLVFEDVYDFETENYALAFTVIVKL